MIKLTRINGKPFTLNACFIEQVESLPDTTITLTSGKKLIVKDSEEEVALKTKQFLMKIGLYASTMDKEENTGV